MLATTREVLDTFTANVVLPYIARNLSASAHEGTWVLTSYLAYVDCFRWYGIVAFLCVLIVFIFRKVKSTWAVMIH